MKQKSTRGLSLFILAGALAALPVMARGQDIPRTQADSLRAEIAQLRAQLDSIRLLLERGEAEPAEEEDALASAPPPGPQRVARRPTRLRSRRATRSSWAGRAPSRH